MMGLLVCSLAATGVGKAASDELGSNTYCDEMVCGAGEGDCDNDDQCQAGLVCVDNVGANYGFRSIVDVCEAPGSAAVLGSNTYCDGISCGAGEGDCDNDNQCQSGLVCVDDVGANYGFRSIVDVCEAPGSTAALGSNTYCDGISCGAGEGDCDNDNQCQSGLVCVDNVGANYGFRSIVDVCEAPGTMAVLGSNTYCDGISCGAGEGDCDNDDQCQSGLVCVDDVGANYGFRSVVDVCEAPGATAVLGSNTYCDGISCGAGEGDCDSDSQCQSGFVCVDNVGANYGFRSVVDVCEASVTQAALGSNTYCDEISCGAGEGDCDSDSQCQAGMVCVDNVGANYGFRSVVDVCEEWATQTALGSETYCDGISCGAGEGDCDSDSQCLSGMVCVNDVGAKYGFMSTVDVCEERQVVDAKLGGVWTGTITSNQGEDEFIGISTDDGRFRFFSLISRAQFHGNISASTNDLSGTGFAVLDRENIIAITIDGQITERQAITGNWRAPSTGESGILDLQYWDVYSRSGSIDKLEGAWTALDGTTAWLELTFNNGNISGTDIFNCVHSGSISAVDPEFNVFLIQDTVTSCSINGTYVGFGALRDVVNTNDGLVFAVDSGKFYVTGLLNRD